MIFTYPSPLLLVRSRSAGSKLTSPKKRSAPWCSSSTILRKIALVDDFDTAPYSFSKLDLPSSVAYCNTFLRSLRSKSGKAWSSQYLKTTANTPSCTSLRSKIRDKRVAPNSDTVARIRTPFCSEIVSSSVGKACG